MRKILRWLIYFISFLSFWFAAINDVPIKFEDRIHGIILVLPLYLLICFGCYSLASVSYSLMTFQDCPEEAKSLEKEREMAITDLRKKGFKFD